MNYTKESLLNIMKNNCKCEIEHDDVFGDYAVMDSVDAFRYCVITGSGYLKPSEPELRKIFKRDMFRVFNQACQYDLQYGVFDEKNLKIINSTKKMFERYPFILDGKKRILFVEYSGRTLKGEPIYNHILRDLAIKAEDNGFKSTDFIITLVNLDKIKDMESFFEYLVCENYSEKGFMTDSQVPFFYATGTPDIAAYTMTELSALLHEKFGLYACSFFELMHLEYLSSNGKQNNKIEDVVFEVKTGSTNGSQIIKYINKHVFDRAYEVIAHKKQKSIYAGLISFDENGKKKVEHDIQLDTINKQEYKNWLNDYAKMYILAGLDDEKYNKFLLDHSITRKDELIKVIKELSIREVLLLGE